MPGVGKKRTGVCSSLKLFGAKSIRFVGTFLASLGLKRRYWQFFFPVGCHCSALWLGGRVTANFGGVDVVPLQGAIVACYGWGGRVTTNFGEWTWCHGTTLRSNGIQKKRPEKLP